jgi:tRNA(Ile)-lysidine synthase
MILTPEYILEICEDLGMQPHHDKVLVALSAGVDSMVLAHLLKEAGFMIHLAHVNFGLRGEASNADAAFCEAWAKAHQIPFYLVHQTIWNLEGSVQMQARQFRYAWFTELCTQHQLQWVATGHHLDDALESLWLNLSRGTGVRGLKGMPQKRGLVVRPLLRVAKETIIAYAKENQMTWREDLSNAETKYKRNQIRHALAPLLKSLNPSWEKGLGQTFDRLVSAERFWDASIQRLRQELLHEDEKTGAYRLAWLEIVSRGVDPHLLAEVLQPYGFHVHSIERLWEDMGAHKPRMFVGKGWILHQDRAFLYLKQADVQEISEAKEWEVKSMDAWAAQPPEGFQIDLLTQWDLQEAAQDDVCFIDADTLPDAIGFRTWQSGDRMVMWGGGTKNLSDLLQEKQVPKLLRPGYSVWMAKDCIFWFSGVRRGKEWGIEPSTKRVWRLWWTGE